MEIIINCSEDCRGSKNVYGEPIKELARCKDCRWHKDEEVGMVYCPIIVGGWVEDDFYCAIGKRKTNADNT